MTVDEKVTAILTDLRRLSGVAVAAVPAEYAGLNPGLVAGDVIYSLNNQRIASLDALRDALKDKKSGDAIALLVERLRATYLRDGGPGISRSSRVLFFEGSAARGARSSNQSSRRGMVAGFPVSSARKRDALLNASRATGGRGVHSFSHPLFDGPLDCSHHRVHDDGEARCTVAVPPGASPVLETGAPVHLVLPYERDGPRPPRVFRQSPASLRWPPTRKNSVEYLHKHPRGVRISKVVTVSGHLAEERHSGEVPHLGGYQVLYSPLDAQQAWRSSTTAQFAWKPEQMELSLPQSVNTGNKFATGRGLGRVKWHLVQPGREDGRST